MSKSRFSGIQVGAIVLNVIGILLVIFGFFLAMDYDRPIVRIAGIDQEVTVVPNIDQALTAVFIAIFVLIAALILAVLGMRIHHQRTTQPPSRIT